MKFLIGFFAFSFADFLGKEEAECKPLLQY